MAKKKEKEPVEKPKDQHKSGFMVRLPESHRLPLGTLKKKFRRPMTEEVQIALEEYYQRQGIPPPAASS